MQTTPETAIGRAIRLGGGITKLARELSVSSHAVVYQWTKTRVPAEKCPDIEKITGVRCEELRPDVNWSVLRAKHRKAKPTTIEAAE